MSSYEHAVNPTRTVPTNAIVAHLLLIFFLIMLCFIKFNAKIHFLITPYNRRNPTCNIA